MVKAPKPPWAYVPAILGMIVSSLAVYQGCENHQAMVYLPTTTGKAGEVLAGDDERGYFWTEARPKLTARSVKPSKASVAATEEELDALDAMREGDFEKAAKTLYDADNQPPPWLVELRKKWGVTNPEALNGPSWEEIEALKPEVKP